MTGSAVAGPPADRTEFGAARIRSGSTGNSRTQRWPTRAGRRRGRLKSQKARSAFPRASGPARRRKEAAHEEDGAKCTRASASDGNRLGDREDELGDGMKVSHAVPPSGWVLRPSSGRSRQRSQGSRLSVERARPGIQIPRPYGQCNNPSIRQSVVQQRQGPVGLTSSPRSSPATTLDGRPAYKSGAQRHSLSRDGIRPQPTCSSDAGMPTHSAVRSLARSAPG